MATIPVLGVPPIQEHNYMAEALKNLPNSIMQGMQMGIYPQQLIANLKQTQAKANLPFGGANVPGPAGQIVGLEMVRQKYGEDSPQYKMAKSAFDLEQQSTGSRINYQNVLAGTAPQRMLTPTGKSFMEEQNVSQGNSPTGSPWSGNAPMAPEEASGVYQLLRQKGATDADTRKRVLLASNIEKTAATIDPDALTQYAGAVGTLKKWGQQGLASFGKESPEYDKYYRSANAAKLLSKQVRQFYGDSIQPSMLEKLEKLADPATWRNNPVLAKSTYLQFIDTLGKEINTYMQGLHDIKVFRGQQLRNQPQKNSNNNDDPFGIL